MTGVQTCALPIYHQLVETVCNRIFDFTADGKLIDRKLSYDEYLARKAQEGA